MASFVSGRPEKDIGDAMVIDSAVPPSELSSNRQAVLQMIHEHPAQS